MLSGVACFGHTFGWSTGGSRCPPIRGLICSARTASTRPASRPTPSLQLGIAGVQPAPNSHDTCSKKNTADQADPKERGERTAIGVRTDRIEGRQGCRQHPDDPQGDRRGSRRRTLRLTDMRRLSRRWILCHRQMESHLVCDAATLGLPTCSPPVHHARSQASKPGEFKSAQVGKFAAPTWLPPLDSATWPRRVRSRSVCRKTTYGRVDNRGPRGAGRSAI